MKSLFTLLLVAITFTLTAQSYSSPESVEYDANHSRYLVSNTNSSTVKQVIPGQLPANFVSAASPYGLAIVGDTVYVCSNSTHLRGYNLTTGTLAFDVNLGGMFLNGICTDYAGNLFVTDFSAKKIVRYNIATQQFNYFVGTAMAKQPNGIVYDRFHNRLVIATWGTNAPILGLSLSDSTVTTLKTTTLTNIDGMTIDEDGNFYAADWGSDGVYFFDSAFANSPVKVVSGLSNPADISYNILSDTLAVPNTSNNTVTFHGFPRPIPVSDFDTVTISNNKTICVLQNDQISGNVPLALQSFSAPHLGTATQQSNCITYTPTSAGNDTLTYVVCSVDTPSFCRTGTLVVTNITAAGGNTAPIAQNDAVSTAHFTPVTVNVAANDEDAPGDTLCVTAISGSSFFALDNANCANIIFTPDSFFTGNDTCRYTVCDNGTPALCDTAFLVVTVNGLAPIAASEIHFDCNLVIAYNTSTGDTGTAVWYFNDVANPITLYGDTVTFQGMFYGEICISVSNQFGNDSACSSFNILCDGIPTIALSNIRLYPNPANNFLTVDMQNNSDDISRNYSSIEIFDATGKKQKSFTRKDNSKTITLDASDLPDGIYVATIITNNKQQKVLGKFTIVR